MPDHLLTVLRIPEGDIVVTRKVPMTDETCDELREIKAYREDKVSLEMGEDVMVPIPTLIKQLIHEEHCRLRTGFGDS